MLTIRRDQFEVFRSAAMQAFEGAMVVHLRDFSPPLFEAVGEVQMRNVIRFGVSQAAAYELTNRGPVRLYLELMLLFGSHFDTDPQYRWTGEILHGDDRSDQMYRAERLFEASMEYRRVVAGKEDAHTLRALRSIARLAGGPQPSMNGDIAAAMQRQIAEVYPEKAAFVGADAMGMLIQEGIASAQKYHFTSERALMLMVVLMLAFGYGCGNDPIYPWIDRTLNDPAMASPEFRATRLERKATTWLRCVLAHFGIEADR